MRVLFVLMLALSGSAVCQAEGDRSESLSRLLSNLKSKSESYRSVRWTFQCKNFRVPDHWDGSIPTGGISGSATGTILYESATGRYSIECTSTTPWVGGSSEYISTVEKSAYDGVLYQRWIAQRHGLEPPPREFEVKQLRDKTILPPLANVSQTKVRHDAVLAHMWAAGIHAAPPFTMMIEEASEPEWLTTQLGAWNELGQIARVSELSDGEWEIVCTQPITGGTYTIKAVVNTNMSGMLTSVKYGATENGPMFREITIEAVEVIPGQVWLPRKLTDHRIPDHRVGITEFDNLEANVALSDVDFRIEMPGGTVVDDNVNRLSYHVAGPPRTEAEKVKDYLVRHGLTPVEEATQPQLLKNDTMIVILCAQVPILIGGWWIVRRIAKKRRALVLAMVSTSLCMEIAIASGGEAIWADGWVLPDVYDVNGPIQIQQCGFTATIATLMLTGVEFDPGVVSRELRPTSQGVSLEKIKRVLQSRGLQVTARAKLTPNDILRSMNKSTVVIAAIELKNAVTHFVVLRHDAQGNISVIDPPKTLRVLKPSADIADQSVITAALFVKRTPKP